MNHQRMANRDGMLRHKLDLINAAHYQIPASALQDLASDPDVVFVTANHPIQAHATGMLDQAAATIGANVVWGSNVVWGASMLSESDVQTPMIILTGGDQ